MAAVVARSSRRRQLGGAKAAQRARSPRVSELNVQELLDRATLAADARWPGASVTDLQPLHGGISSLTFAARLADGLGDSRRVALKVAPPGLPAVGNRDVRRQARVLRALQHAPGVRVPEVLLEDAGSPPFFVMGFVEGQAYEPKKDISPSPPSPEIVQRRARAAARMLGRLHDLVPGEVGLGSEPEVPLTQELDRWARLFATAGDDLRHDEAELHRQLAASVPDPMPARILHGDYRLGNMQFAGDRLDAIIDWEIWSVGDPRTDLAWLLAYCDPVQRFVRERDAPNQAAADAMPDRDKLLAEYLAVRTIEVREIQWFLAYCYYKIASTTAVLAKQNRRRPRPDPALEIAASTLRPVIERGREVLESAWSRQV
jgi:aminoglycoside phosphotransferase (APT) family kinase protein